MNMNMLGNKMMDRFFRKVDNVVWDLFTGRIGVQTNDGIMTLEGSGEDAEVNLNLIDQFGMAVPAFAQNTPIDAVKVGDLIYSDGKPKGWITAINVRPKTEDSPEKKSFTLLTVGGTVSNWKPPKVSLLGFESGVMVLRSLVNMLPDGEGGVANMQNMMLPLMMMGDGELDLDKIVPLMLFSQLGTDGTGNGAMGGNMLQTMMMMQALGGGKSGGSNFFGRD